MSDLHIMSADAKKAYLNSFKEMAHTQKLAEDWHAHFAKAFITQVSEGGEIGQPSPDIYIKVKFKTLDEMHKAFRSMAALAEASTPPKPL